MASSGTGNVRVMCCRSSYETIRGSKNPSFPHEKLARGSPAGFLFVGATTKIIWESLSRVGSNSWPIGRAPHITTCDLMIRTLQGYVIRCDNLGFVTWFPTGIKNSLKRICEKPEKLLWIVIRDRFPGFELGKLFLGIRKMQERET